MILKSRKMYLEVIQEVRNHFESKKQISTKMMLDYLKVLKFNSDIMGHENEDLKYAIIVLLAILKKSEGVPSLLSYDIKQIYLNRLSDHKTGVSLRLDERKEIRYYSYKDNTKILDINPIIYN